MNIAHLLPYSATFPLRKHNGRYDWVQRIARLQVQHGHTVTIYCGPGSTSPEPQLQFRSLSSSIGDKQANNLALLTLAFQTREHDIFHSHLDYLHYQSADQTDRPVVSTQHWFPTDKMAAAVPLNRSRNVLAVPVTHYMAVEDKRLGIPAAKVIYHGIDLRAFKLSDAERSDRLLFVGRIAPHKGVREAVQAAHQAGAKLDIVGKINDTDQAYWNGILPLVDGRQIRYLGPKDRNEVITLLSAAKAMLFLPQQLEAFGQTIIESQACGTPVILNGLGAASELVAVGSTGFIVSNASDFEEAIRSVSSLDPNACRAFAEEFDQQAMVAAYESLYESLQR